MSREAGRDQGSTLVEILVAVVILGITAVALVGGILTGTTSSNFHRQRANAQTLLISAGEALKDPNRNPFRSCTTATLLSTYRANAIVGWSLPAGGWTVDIAELSYWDPHQSPPWVKWTGTCPPEDADNIQRLTVAISSPHNVVTLTRMFVKGPLG